MNQLGGIATLVFAVVVIVGAINGCNGSGGNESGGQLPEITGDSSQPVDEAGRPVNVPPS